MGKLESVTKNNLLWLDSEMCDHITRLGACITALLCSLPTCENIFSFEEPQIFMLMNVVEDREASLFLVWQKNY